MTQIHPTALVDPQADIDSDVEIGPFCHIGPHVQIASGCRLLSHVSMTGIVEIGKENQFFPFVSVGHPPLHLGYRGEPTRVVVGEGNVFREYVSLHRGTVKDQGVTRVGNGNFLMAYTHISHDVQMGSRCVIANSSNMAGHVVLADRVIFGGCVQVAPFVSIGRGVYVAGAASIDRDIPPFCTAMGDRAKLKGVNIIGLKRQKHARHIITEIVDFYRTMEASSLSPRSFLEEHGVPEELQKNPLIGEMATFIRGSKVGIASFLS